MLQLSAGRAALTVDTERGGRIASFRIDGRELLVTDDHHGPMGWGAYPMVPWAGRIRDGRFAFAGQTQQMPITMPPHAIHGTGYLRSWTVTGADSIACELGPVWPYGGTTEQRFALDDDGLVWTLAVCAADHAMPVQVGWHPWFVKPDLLDFTCRSMYAHDDVGIPTGELVDPPPGPWDNCFTDVTQPIRLSWGDLTVELSSDCTDWVIYDRPAHATCVEPQSGPPDGFNLRPEILEAGGRLERRFTLTW